MSPAAKFLRKRTAIEEYIAAESIATRNAFWDRPWENFIGPAVELAEYRLGDEEIPDVTRRRRAVEEYFDMLKYAKEEMREDAAEMAGDYAEASAARQSKALTMFGLDPFGSPVGTMTAMPRRARDFFAAFTEAKTEEDRAQIMNLVSDQERRVYTAQWMRQEAEAIKARQVAGLSTRDDDLVLNQILMARRSDGYEYDDAIEAAWRRETGGKIPFDEWLRRKKKQQYFRTILMKYI